MEVETENANVIDSKDPTTSLVKKRRRQQDKQLTVYPGCDCEYHYRDYTWKKFTEYEPSRNGVEIREFYVVNLSGKELFTYAEGAIGNTRTDTRFPFVCGEIVSSKKMVPSGKLKNVHAWVQLTPEQLAVASLGSIGGGGGIDVGESVGSVRFSDESPLHVRQRYETNANRTMTALPFIVDKNNKVVVFRMQGESLYVQLMPTLHSEYKLVPGTPLFDKNNRGVRAVVGNMFSQNDYVVNCTANEYCEIPTYKNKQGTDRLRLICLDRRGQGEQTDAERKYHQHSSVLSSLVNMGVEAVLGGSSVSGDEDLPRDINPLDASSENELIYEGVVNDKLQITDTFSYDKKHKPPKSVVTVVLDDSGVSVHCRTDNSTVFTWVNRDPNVSYSILPRRFFNAKASVVEINTAARTNKKGLRKYKSVERLI